MEKNNRYFISVSIMLVTYILCISTVFTFSMYCIMPMVSAGTARLAADAALLAIYILGLYSAMAFMVRLFNKGGDK